MPLQSQYSWAQQSPAVPLSCPAQRETQSGPDDVDVDVDSSSQHSGFSKHPYTQVCCSPQNRDPSSGHVIGYPTPEAHIQYLGVQQPSVKNASSTSSHNASQSGSGELVVKGGDDDVVVVDTGDGSVVVVVVVVEDVADDDVASCVGQYVLSSV